MGIFSRVRDIVNSNVNAMLDKAEDPKKLVRLMLREMEDALVEVKASCAAVMADQKQIERRVNQAKAKVEDWTKKARLAVEKCREDLAREALGQKRRFQEHEEASQSELDQCNALVEQYQSDIIQLEEKLSVVREKQRILAKRHTHAREKKRAQLNIRKANSAETIVKFDKFENRIERMEADADLVNCGCLGVPLEHELTELARDEEIEKELEALKASVAEKTDAS